MTSAAAIEYTCDLAGLTPADLAGFFVGWPAPPEPARRLALLHGSQHVVLAKDADRVVGFVTALTDGVLMAYLPLLEVLPEYQGRGIGTELVRRVLGELDRHHRELSGDPDGGMYGIDLCCDDDVVPFYRRLGFQRVNGMVLRPTLTRGRA